MADNRNLEETYEHLKQRRDELKVKLNLGKMDARDTWEDVQKSFWKLDSKMKVLRSQGEVEVEQVKEDIGVLIGHIQDGFERMRDRA